MEALESRGPRDPGHSRSLCLERHDSPPPPDPRDMSNDRSRGAALAAPSSTEGESQTRDPWYDRLLQALHLKPRDSLREGLERRSPSPMPARAVSPPSRGVMLKNVLGLHKVRVDDVMVRGPTSSRSRNDTNLGDLLKLFRQRRPFPLPVYGETLDDPRGMVNIRDLVDHIAPAKAEPARRSAASAVRPATPAEGEADATVAPRTTRRPPPDAQVPRPRQGRPPPRWRPPASSGPVLFVPPSMRPSTCWCGCRRRAPIWPWSSTSMAALMGCSPSRT